MKDQYVLEAAVEHFASRSHNAWRRKFQKANPREAKKPRMRLRGGEMVDINKPWSQLHPRAQADNRSAARDAYQALLKHPKDREAAARYVHQRWIARNKGDPNQPRELFKPYSALPEHEKDKDRAHVDSMRAALAAVKAKKAISPKKTSKKQAKPARRPAAAKSFTLDAKTVKRLEAAAKRMSAVTGRKVAIEELAQAAVRAMLLVYEV